MSRNEDLVYLRRKRARRMVGAKLPDDLADRFQKVVDKHFGGNQSAALRRAILDLINKYKG